MIAILRNVYRHEIILKCGKHSRKMFKGICVLLKFANEIDLEAFQKNFQMLKGIPARNSSSNFLKESLAIPVQALPCSCVSVFLSLWVEYAPHTAKP